MSELTNPTPSEETTRAADEAASAAGAEAYIPENIQVLRDAAHIRQRPGMYIGDTTSNGLHHLVYELIYNSVDEALAGFCKNIHVKINVDNSLSVTDDGRGIPVDIHPEMGLSTLEVVLTMSGAGAKFDKRTYKTSAGLHGMGAKAVTALSEWTEAEVRRNGRVYMQEFERGKATSQVKDIGAAGTRTGTKVTFMPDPEIFRDANFNYDTLEARLRELAFLNKGLGMKLTDERTGKEETFKYDGGLAEFVEHLNRSEDALHSPPIYVDKTVDEVRVEVAIQYTTGEEDRTRCYTNNAYNSVGGTHLSGFRTAITRTLNTYGNKEGLFKNDLAPIGEDLREGMTAIVSVQVPEPQFESNNKLRLNNPEVDGIVASVVSEELAKYLEENPKDATKIMKKVILAAEAREAAARAKKQLKDRKSMLSSGGLPGKLMDCISRDRDESELFLVEGGSAGGSADNGRDRTLQAILPLRGKVLNVEKARTEKVSLNEEIGNLITAIGIDIGNSEDVSRLRYGKIIILTDADVDGQHIRTLLLTFFFRQMIQLIKDSRIYVARPPLYKVVHKKETRYVQSIDTMEQELLDRGIEGARMLVNTQQDSKKEKTEPIVYEGDRLRNLLIVLDELEEKLAILERRGLSVSTLLGHLKDGKLPAFRVLLGNQEHWFFNRAEMDAFRQQQQQQGKQLIVADEETSGNGHGEVFGFLELHEISHGVNPGLEKLVALGLKPSDLVPAPRVAGREPIPRFFLENDGRKQMLPHLRVLVGEIRKFGEKGIKITRFKGLGEMDGEELWDTTLDPKRRTLLKVQMDDALKADEMFRILMGEKVEPRRDFIQKHALEVSDIDYHGA